MVNFYRDGLLLIIFVALASLFLNVGIERMSGEVSQPANREVEGQTLKDSSADSEKVDLNSASCGQRKTSVRILGGAAAKPHFYPWLVALVIKSNEDTRNCGGTIVNERFILTAAHCVFRHEPGDVKILVAKHLWQNDKDEEIFHVKNITIHEEFDFTTDDADIAMIELKDDTHRLRSMITDKKGWVRPICLPTETCSSENNCYVKRSAVVSGWGRFDPTIFEGTDSVHHVDVPILDNAECKQNYTDVKTITSWMVCAGKEGEDSCKGDSGGPLAVHNLDGTHTLVGVVSFGVSCGLPQYPGVYTRVTEFLPWIRDNSQL